MREGGNAFDQWAKKLQATGETAAKVREDPSLADRPLAPPEWKKLLAAFDRIAKHGYQKLEKTKLVKTWTLDDGTEVAEVRKGGVRVFFFEEEPVPNQGPTRLVLTHGYRKQSGDTPDREIRRFLNLQDLYYENRESGTT